MATILDQFAISEKQNIFSKGLDKPKANFCFSE
jgi:hypothetical protein